MKTFYAFIKKEFIHIKRDSRTLCILLLMPVVLVLLFGFALTNDIKKASIALYDPANDDLTRPIAERVAASEYFKLIPVKTADEAEALLRSGKAKAVLAFPQKFSQELKNGGAQVRISADACDPNEAVNISNYLEGVILSALHAEASAPPFIDARVNFLYNPQLKSAYNFVPGVMGLILFLICTLMTSIGIVKEKELGTMEVLLTSPVKPLIIILSKTIPYFIISAVIVCIVLLVARWVLDVPIRGSIWLLFSISGLYSILGLSIGILISTVANTQQTAMFISTVFMILSIMLLSGMIFPVENMPKILQAFSKLVPASWYISAVKDVMLKGRGFFAIWRETVVLCAMTVFCIALSVMRFKTTLE